LTVTLVTPKVETSQGIIPEVLSTMRTLVRSAALLASLALPLGLTSSAFATSCETTAGNLVTNCGFESGDFTGWTVVDPSNNTYVDSHFPYTGTYSANLGGTPGTLSQTLTDMVGTNYAFSFAMQNEVAVDGNGVPYPGTNTFGVSVIDASNTTNALMSPTSITQTAAYQLYSFNFVGTGSDTIQFDVNNVPSYFNLDNVIVNEATPEPSSLALMGTGALVFAEITRRRMKKI
jgi:hypothetical protein